MRIFPIALALLCSTSSAQFAPERIASGLELLWPADRRTQANFQSCIERLHKHNTDTLLGSVGLHSMHVLARLSTTPAEHQPQMIAALLSVRNEACLTATPAPSTEVVRQIKFTNVFTYLKSGKIARSPAEVKRDVCINTNWERLGLAPAKVIAFKDLSSDQKTRAIELCK